MNILHFVSMVLVVMTITVAIGGSSNIDTIGSSAAATVLLNDKKSSNDERLDQLHSHQVTIDANSVVTSSEMQGATPKIEIENSSSVQYNKNDGSSTVSTTSSLPSSEAIKKESSSLSPPPSSIHSSGTANQEKSSSNNQNQNESKLKEEKLNSQQLAQLSTTTHRNVRNGGLFQNRDNNKLMSLLAARRSAALQLGRFRTHRRVPTTNTTVVEASSSKNSQDPRTTCERNCTKNFTRRITASCMRRCIMVHKVPNSTTTPSSVRTKVDEKDNNEILLTDESSHGFFVVTKELNDTVNHISTDTKMVITSTEKNHKAKTRSGQQISAEEIDMSPYVYFGRKLPPLKPTVLRISKVDDHPKVLEISVTKPTERSRGRTRYHPRERNIVAYNRRHGLSNLTRYTTSTTTSTTTDKPSIGLFRESSEEKLIKEATMDDNVSLTVLARSAENNSHFAKLVLDENNTFVEGKPNVTTETPVHNLSSVTLVLEDQSTPLIISVPELEEATEVTTQAPRVPIPKLQPAAFNIPYAPHPPEEKPNLIIFFNVTTPRPATTTRASHQQQPSSTTTSTTPKPTTTTSTTTTTTTTSTTSTTTTEKTPNISSTVHSFTRTTVSSSVRSTVNSRSTNSTKTTITTTTSNPLLNSSPPNPPVLLNRTVNVPENFTFSFETFPNVSPSFHERNPSTSDIPVVEGNVVQDNEVTIEMQRINMATYVLAGLGMFPLVVIILYVVKTLIFKRRMKDDGDLDHCMNDEQPITPVRKMDQNDDDRNDHYSVSSDQEFDRSNLRFKSLLGEGNFGQVWKAEADDLSGHMGATRIVAVKTVRTGSSQSGLREEAQIMRKLGSHPNVVTLLGACIESEPHLLIMEYAMRGRLLSLLRAARSATNILPASVPGGRSLAPLSPRTLAGFSLDIARGMEYISDRRIVHRDLAARNVLLDHNGVCKICDFGMSIDLDEIKNTQPPTRKVDIMRHTNALENRFRFDFGGRLINHWSHINHNNNNNNNNVNQANHEKKQHDSISKRPALPIRWMAPEALQYHIFSPETDVWAFGIVLWEIATLGCTPYPNLSGREVIRCVPNGTRPDPPKDGRAEFWDLMCRCWHKDPRDRPTFREARIEISRSMCNWVDDDTSNSDYMDVSGFSEDLEHGMVYFNRRISEFECEI